MVTMKAKYFPFPRLKHTIGCFFFKLSCGECRYAFASFSKQYMTFDLDHNQSGSKFLPIMFLSLETAFREHIFVSVAIENYMYS